MSASGRPIIPIDWDTIERAADEGERSRLESLSSEEVERELRAAGFEPEEADRLLQEALSRAEPAAHATSATSLRVLDGGLPQTKKASGGRSRMAAIPISAWVAATAVAAGFLLLWLAGPSTSVVLKADPKQARTSAALRAEAATACSKQSWSECEERLNQARAMDPDGERDPRVVEERREIAEHSR